MRTSLWLRVAMAVLLAGTGIAAAAQITYSAGHCDGSVGISLLEHVQFAPETLPAPQYLWVFVQTGAGNVIISDGNVNVSDGFYLSQGNLYLFPSTPPFDFYFQDEYVLLLYGGADLDGPAGPVCVTGANGPSIFLGDKRLNVQAESAAATSLQMGQYTAVSSLVSGTLPYTLAMTYASLGTSPLPACTACCAPTQALFSAPGATPASVYRLDPTPAADFDYALVVPSALQASASANPLSGDVPLKVSFTGAASGGSPPYTWDWNFGDGSVHSTAQDPVHTYSAQGTYDPVLTVKDASAATSKDTHLTITAGPTFTATAAASPLSGLTPLTVAFTGTATGGTSPYTYSWDFKDGGTSTDQNPSHTYLSAGTYNPALTVKDSAGLTATDTHLSITTTSPAGLTASALADRPTGIPPFPVNSPGAASGGTAPYTFSWNFGDGSTATTGAASHIYSTLGTFTVVLTVQDSAGASAVDSHLVISSVPFLVTAIANPPSGTVPLTVQFAATVTGGTAPFTFEWDFGDGSGDNHQAPQHVYSVEGVYAVSVTVTDSTPNTVTDSHLSIQVSPAASTAVVTGVKTLTDPFRLKVTGSNFEPGCAVLINGQNVPSTSWKSLTQVMAKGGSTLKTMVPKGQAVCVTVQNHGGSPSACFTYTR